MTTQSPSLTPRYEPDERPSQLMALSLAFQSAVQALPANILFPLIMVKAIGGSGTDYLWAIFSMLLVNGITVILQALRIGPVGSGLIVATYPSITALPFCILALDQGGPTILAALILVSAVTQILISYRLSLVRKIVTPKVSGTILILLIITIVPILFGNISDVPGSTPSTGGCRLPCRYVCRDPGSDAERYRASASLGSTTWFGGWMLGSRSIRNL